MVYHVSDELESTLVFLLHRSDSNQGTDYIATFLSLISDFQTQKFKYISNGIHQSKVNFLSTKLRFRCRLCTNRILKFEEAWQYFQVSCGM